MNRIELEHEKKCRERAAAGRYSSRELNAMATVALLKAYGMAPVDTKTAWQYAQYAADMLRASLQEREAL